jgi:hypothetical protein
MRPLGLPIRCRGGESRMATFANALALLGFFLIRFGDRGGGGFVFMLLGLAVVAVVAYALARPSGNESAKN